MSNAALDVLERFLSPAMAKVVFRRTMAEHGSAHGNAYASGRSAESLAARMYRNAATFVHPGDHRRLQRDLDDACATRFQPGEHRFTIATEDDARRARMATRDLCVQAGAPKLQALKVALALSELSRNILDYAGEGEVVVTFTDGHPRRVSVRAVDRGPGIADIDEVLSGNYVSRTGLGRGLLGTKRMSDHFDVATGPGGTTVHLEMQL